ncbi:hypothetical protein CMESO_574 (nucleomorph) [Chroomonas mesostigmatica CCMP1168]|uniref:GINS subunit domain-containing protein n=1 Tax=Chroomonas mesostigmatica CCMP1168 TaxID=1195612 RepID=J7G8D8_9CRYP|nr:hypothetical protein CMESO_7 [Chroomonas mesostigmatica CCMP1168]AFP65371.1 hypothetical protein CMESO_187 [Chroomonas mesostigmatica CCMP1168]AFP65376.1 hypothetical protein CMESO_200 [Chroomonas mesostigmatica CCMP1168]AFP65543.1 hypothetical protein CMESO_380 [Chroomonas mesostigmatica CCMP1168]AFP65548.1 hypothetical protein CMESO_393 [Chroomonas mesostigmatica CCMP1168]
MDFFLDVFEWHIFFTANDIVPCEIELVPWSLKNQEMTPGSTDTIFFNKSNTPEKKPTVRPFTPNITVGLPFWVGKIVSMASFGKMGIPQFLDKKILKKKLISPARNFSNLYRSSFHRFYALGIKIGKTIQDEIIQKAVKKIFWKKFFFFFYFFFLKKKEKKKKNL